jgi:hypothetical protein
MHPSGKDTVLLRVWVWGWTWKVDDNQIRIFRASNDEFIQFDTSIHTLKVLLIPATGGEEG